MRGAMKHIVAFATGVLAVTSAAGAAPPRPAVEHFGRPSVNGYRLAVSGPNSTCGASAANRGSAIASVASNGMIRWKKTLNFRPLRAK